jgi:hypothetical protein
MRFNEDTLDWGMKQMNQLKHLRGFPELPEGIEAVAAALLRIAHPVLVLSRLEWGVHCESTFNPSSDMINPGAEALSIVRIPHPKIEDSPVNPMNWIINHALDNFQFFPAPVELRRIFMEKFPAADGVYPTASIGKSFT